MKEYPKIQTFWKRDLNFKIIEGSYAKPEFALVDKNKWIFQEKIDGMNMRIHWDGKKVLIHGRTDNAQIPGDLKLYGHFTEGLFNEIFPNVDDEFSVTLYGEGYGPGIQKDGGKYRSDKWFILFDVKLYNYWQPVSKVKEFAELLRVPVVQEYNNNYDDMMGLLRTGSLYSLESVEERLSEGVIMRTDPILLDRQLQRVISKLKIKDFSK